MKTKAAFLASIVLLSLLGLGIYESTRERHVFVEISPQAVEAPAPEAGPVLQDSSRDAALNVPQLADEKVGVDRGHQIITGVVQDTLTGIPIPGACVLIEKQEFLTDLEGVYIARDPGCDPCSLKASAAGYADRPASVHRNPDGITVQDFALDPTTVVLVTVVGEDGEPIPSAKVVPSMFGSDGGFFVDDALETEATGQVSIPGISRLNPPALRAWKDGYRSSSTERLSIEKDKPVTDVRIVLRKIQVLDRAIVGRVTDPKGRPIPKVSIVWKDGERTRFAPDEKYGQIRATTDKQGFYRLEFQDDYDRCHLGVSGSGWAPTVRLAVKPGTPEQPAEVNFTLEPGHWLEGRVVDEESRPVPDAEVLSMPRRELLNTGVAYPGILRKAKTGEDGKFRLEDLAGPTVAVELKGPTGGGWPHHEEELGVDQSVDLVLKRYGVVRGRVFDKETGQPVQVFAVKPGGGDPGESFTSADGRFVLKSGLPYKSQSQGATVSLIVEADGFVPVVLRQVPVMPERSAEELEVRLSRGHLLRGLVLDARTGAALEDVKVILTAPEQWERDLSWVGWDHVHLFKGAQRSLTGAAGTFSFKEDEPGTLLVQASGYQRVLVRPEERPSRASVGGVLRIPLEPGETLSGVYHQDGKPKSGVAISLLRLPGGASGSDGSQRGEPASREKERQHFGFVLTDAEGKFRWNDLQPGAYLVEALRITDRALNVGVRMRRRVVLVPGEEKCIDIGDDAGSLVLSGTIMDSMARPIRMGSLVLTPAFEWSYAELSVDVFGYQDAQFTLPGLKPGRYNAAVELEMDSGIRTIRLDPIDVLRDSERRIVVPSP